LAAPPDAASPARARLAGLRARALSALVFVPCALVVSWRGGVYFTLFVGLLLVLGTRELLRMQRARKLDPDGPVALGAALLLPWTMREPATGAAEASLALCFLLAVGRGLWRGRVENAVASLGATVFAVVYVGWLGSHLVRLRELPRLFAFDESQGFLFVLLAFAFTWISDTGGYFFGILFGRHRLAPRLSPGKSVEGALAAVLLTAAAGYLGAVTLLAAHLQPWEGALLGALASAAGQVGDLLESLVKRDAGFKDASRLIPGHGGILDRFDSVLFAAPLLYYALRFVVL
jgi:phosphatidate cytidylyltransferase